ncbi:hypothetical protein ACPOLB_11310 [Rubrivivax sp. RP6-9]|uniref:hypothetical protein n=1 Tax=Rubrivivax sp. RP6-9 TaxID=3415750 RepID=UPI003CC66212
MTTQRPDSNRPARWRAWSGHALAAVAALVGAKFSYDFGLEISGRLLAWLLALNSAVFCALVVGALADRLLGARGDGG